MVVKSTLASKIYIKLQTIFFYILGYFYFIYNFFISHVTSTKIQRLIVENRFFHIIKLFPETRNWSFIQLQLRIIKIEFEKIQLHFSEFEKQFSKFLITKYWIGWSKMSTFKWMQAIPPNRFEIRKSGHVFFFSKFVFLMVSVGTLNYYRKIHRKKSLFGIFRIIVQG